MTVLDTTDRVNTVRAKLRMSPSHRMIAALTPSSLALSSTASTIWDTAYSPNTDGPNTVRASSTPTAKLLIRTTIVFSRLHRVPDRTRLSRSFGACSAASTRGRSDAAIGYIGGSTTTARAGPMTSATRPGRRCAPAAACRTAMYTVRSRNASRPMAARAAAPPMVSSSPSPWPSLRAANTMTHTPADTAMGTARPAPGSRGQMASGLSSVRNQGTRNSSATHTLTTATATRPRW
jgi:hypothetical protein